MMKRCAARNMHVEPLKNFGIINSITKLHLVGISNNYFRNFRPLTFFFFFYTISCIHTIVLHECIVARNM
jgi:hypothetical protein